MAAGVGGVLTTLLIISIFMQFKSVLFNQNSNGHVDFAPGFQWPVLTSKISCFGKDILQHFISKSQCTEKSSQHSRNVRTIPLIGCICLLLSGDIL